LNNLIKILATPRDSLVYRFTSYDKLNNAEKEDHWKLLEPDELRKFFPDEFLIRRSCIESFRKKHWCVIVYNDTEWITYGWIRPPYTAAPPHLPHRIRNTGDYWLYTASTKKKFQRMGYNKYIKKLRIDHIYNYEGRRDVDIYTDTVEGNIPSRRSMLSSGFVTSGILTRYYIKSIKYLNYVLYRNRWGYVWGEWDKEREHPGL
jgi:RimJ/RimL family protein N-acetyltransferase